MPEYGCLSCGKPTTNRSKRCDRHDLVPRPRGNGFEPIRQMIFARDGGRCQECGVALTQAPRYPNSFHLGHVQARTRGGTDEPSNYLALCADCNLQAGADGRT